jgi:hypothetical protein
MLKTALRSRMSARGNVDGLAINIPALLDNNVAKVEPDP